MIELVLPPIPQYNEIIMEVHCAVGGKESMLFAREIYTMYRNLAYHRGWEFNEVDVISEEKGLLGNNIIQSKNTNFYCIGGAVALLHVSEIFT